MLRDRALKAANGKLSLGRSHGQLEESGSSGRRLLLREAIEVIKQGPPDDLGPAEPFPPCRLVTRDEAADKAARPVEHFETDGRRRDESRDRIALCVQDAGVDLTALREQDIPHPPNSIQELLAFGQDGAEFPQFC